MAGLLTGIKVVESAVLMTGDCLGGILADQGADVIKVEQPGIGDYLREFTFMIAPHNSAFHLFLNKNKRSLTLDMRKPEAREIFYRLIDDADAFVTGNIADTPKRLGMDYETLSARKPGLVYCQATGYGADGPYGNIPTHGNMMNALAGDPPLTMGPDGHVTRSTEVLPGGGIIAGHGVATGPLWAAYGVVAALLRRERTGQGAYLDVSCADALLAHAWVGALNLLNEARITPEWGEGNDRSIPSAKYQFYQTKDERYVLFCCIEAKFWRSFCRVVDRPDLALNIRAGAVDQGCDPELRNELQRIFHTKTQDEWVTLFRENDIAAGPVTNPRELELDPHLAHREMVIRTMHPVAGEFIIPGDPIKVRGEHYELRHHAPALGQHTDEILGDLGYSAGQIAELREAAIV